MTRTRDHTGAPVLDPDGAGAALPGGVREIGGRREGAGLRIGVAVSRFNHEITERLLHGALSCLAEQGVAGTDIIVLRVPGAWELPLAARWLLDHADADAVVALGCVIRGETPHFEFVAGEAARGLADTALSTGAPIAFGVLTTDTVEQALQRAGGAKGDKGRDAALSALEMANALKELNR